jgi:hypothetical protein
MDTLKAALAFNPQQADLRRLLSQVSNCSLNGGR